MSTSLGNITTFLICLLFSLPLSASEAIVAVAANFTDADRQIAKQFESTPSHCIKISYGSMEKLYAKIANECGINFIRASLG